MADDVADASAVIDEVRQAFREYAVSEAEAALLWNDYYWYMNNRKNGVVQQRKSARRVGPRQRRVES